MLGISPKQNMKADLSTSDIIHVSFLRHLTILGGESVVWLVLLINQGFWDARLTVETAIHAFGRNTMNKIRTTLINGTMTAALAAIFFSGGREAVAQSTTEIPPAITTPDKVETRIGTLDFKDGMPSKDTVAKLYDNLDFTHAFEAFVNTMEGVSIEALRKGFLSVGVNDNEVLIFSELMDAKSLFLTANADTVYFLGVLDLSKGPMVLEVPPKALGAIDDHWFRWVTDFGAPGPDRGEGGKYLILPPGYDGPLPEGGFFVAHARTNRVLWFGRMFLENNDPKPAVALIKEKTKIYPYEVGGVGTSIAES
jgi:Protein of unknown function (DUF1254)